MKFTIYIAIVLFGFSIWLVYLREKPVLILGIVLISDLILPKITLPFGTQVTISDVLLPLQAVYSLMFLKIHTARNSWFVRFSILYIAIGISIYISINVALVMGNYVTINDWLDVVMALRYYSAFVIAFYMVDANFAFRKMSNVLIACTIFACILGWGQVYDIPIAHRLVPLYDTRESTSRALELASRRAIGTMWNPNIFGSFINLTIALVFGRILGSNRKITKTHLYEIIILAFFLLTIFQTASRTNLVGAGTLFIAIFAIYDSKKRNRYSHKIVRLISLQKAGFFTLMLFIVIGLLAMVTTNSYSWSRIIQNTTVQKITTLNGRTIAWGKALTIITQSPKNFLFGDGTGYNFFVDNEFLRIWLRLGFLSFLSYTSLILAVFMISANGLRNLKSFQDDQVMFLTLMGMLVVWCISAIAGPFYSVIPLMTTISIFIGLVAKRIEDLDYGK